MFQKIKAPLSLYISFFLILTILIFQYNTFKIRSSENPCPIAWDVYGYYLYLPATFIYNDLGLENKEWINKTREKYNPSSTFYQVADGKENKKVIIYNIGYAIINAPGFFIANSLASPLGYEKDGFSKPYQLALLFTAFLFSVFGIFLLREISLSFFSDKMSSILLFIIVLGTNYFYQAVYDGVMPHNILFTLNCCILLFTIKWHQNQSIKNISLLAFFIGLATICRPTELIWIIIPLFWNTNGKHLFIEKIKFLFKNYLQVFLFLGILILFLCIQLFYLKFASGSFLKLNLHNEGFSFFDPYTYKFLFSYKKGWLLYTPIMIFGIVGFYYLRKQNKNIWMGLFIFFILNLYVVSSWECWWYAASFSQRPMVEIYPMMIFPLGACINQILKSHPSLIKYFWGFIFCLLIGLNQFQIWQYKNGILTSETMTQKYYWKIFGKREASEKDKDYLGVNRFQETFNNYTNYKTHYYKKELNYTDYENDNNPLIIDTLAFEGKKSFSLSPSQPYSPAFEENYYDLTNKSHLWIKASVWVYLTAPYTQSNSGIVISTESKGKPYKYLTSNYEKFNIQPFHWTKIYLDFLTPIIRHNYDKVKIYFWNMGSKTVFIDNFKIEAFEPKFDFE